MKFDRFHLGDAVTEKVRRCRFWLRLAEQSKRAYLYLDFWLTDLRLSQGEMEEPHPALRIEPQRRKMVHMCVVELWLRLLAVEKPSLGFEIEALDLFS